MIKMKNSGIDWIGEIPAHWEVRRFKELFRNYSTGFTPDSKDMNNFTDEDINTWITIGDLNSRVVTQSNMYLSEKAISENMPIITPKGSLLFSFKLSIGKTAFAGKDLYTNEAIVSIPPHKHIDLRYFYYIIPNTCLNNATENIYGAKMLNQKLIANMMMLIPPIKEQQAIADYLDEKTVEIDKQVELLDQKQKAYQKLKVSLINQVVTRGLNPNAPLRDSEIDWIGKIPAHWDVRRIKDIATLGSGTTPKSSNEKYYEFGTYPWLITGDVQNRLIESNENFITDLALSDVPTLKLYPSKTVLLAMYGGGTIGNVGLMTYPAYINQACCAMIPKSSVFEKYLFYYLLTKQERIISTGVGGTQVNLNQNKISAYPIAIPPIEEQQAIANYLDEKTADIDEAITYIDKKIKAYKRLKQSLVDEVVTGKRKI